MRFVAEHRFSAPPEAVAAVLVDPEFQSGLELPDVGAPQILESAGAGSRSVLRLRYRFAGTLNPVARRLIGGDRLSWDQELELDRSSGVGALSFRALADPDRFHGSARLSLLAVDGGCVRRLDGELVVAVPLIGAGIEKNIVAGLRRRLDIEAAAVSAVLADRSGSL